ncbi:hypothetical protein [Actinomyces ruminis]|uniref:hypothetical protein n=1 Tax=Actinomyces ruminis TaxID=1937003 RepID=UPI0015D4F388|nr:hypothetical protein [Actinomyces ruminis]
MPARLHRELLTRARAGGPDAVIYRAVVARATGEQPQADTDRVAVMLDGRIV